MYIVQRKSTNDPIINDAMTTLQKLFQNIRICKSDETRSQASKQIFNYIDSQQRDLSTETFRKFFSFFKEKIDELFSPLSPNIYHQLSALSIVDECLDLDFDTNNRISFISKHLQNTLLCQSDSAVLTQTSKVIGHLASATKTSFSQINNQNSPISADFIETMINWSFSVLNNPTRNESRRLAAVLVLKELGNSATIIFYKHIPQLMDLIWVALTDSLVNIRVESSILLGNVMNMMGLRDDPNQFIRFRDRVIDEAMVKLNSPNMNHIHGGLLAISQLLQLKTTIAVGDKVKGTINGVLKFKNHKNKEIKQMVVEIIPNLIGYSSESYLILSEQIQSLVHYCLDV